MTSADVQLIDRIRLQEHVPPAGSFEVYSSPRGWTWYIYKQESAEYFLGFESRMSVFFGYWSHMLYFLGLLNNCCISKCVIF